MSTVPDAIPEEDEEPPPEDEEPPRDGVVATQAVSAPDASSPAALVVPARQAVQALDETYSSTKHVVATQPEVPAVQSSQSSTLSWEVSMPSPGMVEPAGHTEHVSVPVFEAYESAGHTEHGPASAEKVPAAQRPQETQDPPPSTSALALVPSEPGPHEQSRVPLL